MKTSKNSPNIMNFSKLSITGLSNATKELRKKISLITTKNIPADQDKVFKEQLIDIEQSLLKLPSIQEQISADNLIATDLRMIRKILGWENTTPSYKDELEKNIEKMKKYSTD